MSTVFGMRNCGSRFITPRHRRWGGETNMSLNDFLGLWKVWLLGVAMTGLTAFSIVSPVMGEGVFYEIMFGLVALVAFGYGVRTLRSEDRYRS